MIKNISKRAENFELLRIVSILMVITLHFLTNSQLKEYIDFYSYNGFLFIFFKCLCFTADNLFILLSGYFLINSKFKISKVFDLWIQVFFYSVGIPFVLVITGLIEFSLKTTYYSIFPIYSKQYWFFSCYILLYIISPLLNIVINNIQKKVHLNILIVGFILFSVLYSMTLNKDPFYIANGKNLLWFIYLYMCAAYLRKYEIKVLKIKPLYLIAALFLIIITVISYYGLDILINKFDIPHIKSDNFIALLSITIFPASILIFLFFKNLSIKSNFIGKTLIFLSPLTFGIYLLHDNTNLRPILWGLIQPEKYANSPMLIVCCIVSVLLIYISGCIIEYIRQKMFNLLKIKSISLLLEKKITKWLV